MRTSSTKAAYPEFNQSASRMAAALGEDIEVAQPDTSVARAQAPPRALADQDEAHAMLQEHKKKRHSDVLSERDVQRAHRCRNLLFVLTCVQAVVVPAVCLPLAFLNVDPGSAVCASANQTVADCTTSLVVEQRDLTAFLLFVPVGFSLALLAIAAYRERGPGGVLEHRGARLGCLPVTARPREEGH